MRTRTAGCYAALPPNVHELCSNEIPSWTLEKPKCHWECNVTKKDQTCQIIFRTAFNPIIHHYPDSKIIYTEGSKTNEGVGSAFIVQNTTYA